MSIHNETLLSGLALVTFLTHHQHTCIEFPSTLAIDTFRPDDLFRISVSVSVSVPVLAFRVFHLPGIIYRDNNRNGLPCIILPYLREKGPMGGAPYIGSRLGGGGGGGGGIFEVLLSQLDAKERPGKLSTRSS